jgi:hypothetical protein
VGPNEALVFDVELLAIKAPAGGQTVATKAKSTARKD